MQQRQRVAILQVMKDHPGQLGSARIADEIQAYGVDLSPRAVRLYLEQMQLEGLVEPARRGRSGGRRITEFGLHEIDDALVVNRVGLTAARMDELAWGMDFDPLRACGKVVLNLSFLHASLLRPALKAMLPVFRADLGMGRYLCVLEPGTAIGESFVPEGQVAIGTVCSVTVNGILLSRRIPTTSRFAGVLEYIDGLPTRFTDIIAYDGTSLDPLEIFIKGRLTDITGICTRGRGRLGASFREVPTPALPIAMEVFEEMSRLGLGRVLELGRPKRSVFGFPVSEGKTGFVVPGGLNPLAALEEARIGARNHALSQLYEFEELECYEDLARRFGL